MQTSPSAPGACSAVSGLELWVLMKCRTVSIETDDKEKPFEKKMLLRKGDVHAIHSCCGINISLCIYLYACERLRDGERGCNGIAGAAV